jgi:hypothetical protein
MAVATTTIPRARVKWCLSEQRIIRVDRRMRVLRVQKPEQTTPHRIGLGLD